VITTVNRSTQFCCKQRVLHLTVHVGPYIVAHMLVAVTVKTELKSVKTFTHRR